jgi:hypothetical protein
VTRLSLALGLLACAPAAARADDPRWFPFALPWDDASPTGLDAGSLNPVPAGGRGSVRARDGHFYDADGRRVRFLGVNFTFNANFPDKEDAAKVAARLHKFGINVVRLHHMDWDHAPVGIFDRHRPDTRRLDPDQLDRLDYLVDQLKRHGVYVNINLHVSRSFAAADGVPPTAGLPDRGKALAYFEPRLLALQKEYARDLLTHRNPYTGARYVDEPAVAFIELTNENSLLGAALGGALGQLPDEYRGELLRQWNAWLRARYSDTAGLRRAWGAAEGPAGANLLKNSSFTDGTAGWALEHHEGARAELRLRADAAPAGVPGRVLRVLVGKRGGQAWHAQLVQPGLDLREGEPYTLTFWAKAEPERRIAVGASLDEDDWHGLGLSERPALGTQWRQFRFVFAPARTRPGHARLALGFGDVEGAVDLAGLALRPGAEGVVPEGATLEAGTVPPAPPAAGPAGRDWVAFLLDAEGRYLRAMRDYVKNDLGARANVTCSQASYGGLGGLWRESGSDYTDMHAYWDHPHFPHRPWDPADWRIPNRPMTRDREGGTLPGLARYRLDGKPFTVSEYNHPAPNDYQAEGLPMLAAFAALQDWDGIYLFDYNDRRDSWAADRVRGFFAVASNPAKMALFPAAARIFLRGDVPPAAGALRLDVPAGGVADQLTRATPDIRAPWDAVGVAPRDALTHRLSVRFVEGKGAPTLARPAAAAGPGPLRWEGVGTDRALFTADSARSKLMVGFLGGRAAELPGWRVEVPRAGPAFAVLALTSLDGEPTERSRSLLLTAVGRVENPGMGWDARRTTVGRAWGTGPVRAEGVAAAVRVATQHRAAAVYALDTTGRRRGRVEARMADGGVTFDVGPAHQTLWYEIAAENPATPGER